uniref:Uncharacterized protein n=1 Tax=Aegilops tauschii subsp. strangulata TaxID=200361 RepID=A0A453L510_AEGTS
QRLLRMVDGLNFKEFVSFLSTFSARASLQQKIECNAHQVIMFLFLFLLSILKGVYVGLGLSDPYDD